MRVYTRTGDRGDTGLLYGGRVFKDHPRTQAYGTIDEVVSVLGLARAELRSGATEASERFHDDVLFIQRELFAVGAQLATEPEKWDRLEVGVSRVDDGMVARLERRIDELVAQHPLPTEFIVPGSSRAAASLDVARSVTRRAERAVVTMLREKLLPESALLRYVNRLSDYLYVLARAIEGEHVPSRVRDRPGADEPTS